MGTAFDNFSDTAHHDFVQLPQRVWNNRKLLKRVMEEHGFQSLSSEWWHYQWHTQEHFDIIDLDFDELSETLKDNVFYSSPFWSWQRALYRAVALEKLVSLMEYVF
jgi:glycine/serine hydroxymethyltransferase